MSNLFDYWYVVTTLLVSALGTPVFAQSRSYDTGFAESRAYDTGAEANRQARSYDTGFAPSRSYDTGAAESTRVYVFVVQNTVQPGSSIVEDEAFCAGDIDGNRQVDIMDVLSLLEEFGPCDLRTECRGDLDGNEIVDQGDLDILMEGWGHCDDVVEGDRHALFAAPNIVSINPDAAQMEINEGVCLDMDGDNDVGITDLLALIEEWGSCGTVASCTADFNADGIVNDDDLDNLLKHWGPCAE